VEGVAGFYGADVIEALFILPEKRIDAGVQVM
jgi:hypothetical protein